MVVKWKVWVPQWESKQHADGTESLFEVQEKSMTMKEICLKLAKEELITSREGVEVEREETSSTFILMGLEIEESQRHLAVDIKAITNPTPQPEHEFLKRRTAICNVATADATKCAKACAAGLPEVESTLREGEAHDMLEALCQIKDSVHLLSPSATEPYAAMPPSRPPPHHADHGQPASYCSRSSAVTKRFIIVRTRNRWYTAKAGELSEQELVDTLRVKWCRAYAWMRCWHEDIVLIEEEMRRTILYGYWESREWLQRSTARGNGVDAVLQEGLKAYASEQVHREVRTCEDLRLKWAYWRERRQLYLARKTSASDVIRVEEEVRALSNGEDDTEEAVPDYEEEEDTLE
ncbi:hypothetical protein C8R45DRAFT_1090202 [Mycena sanguinolenta]|nr:hypothetical protein C8R45DRAFT_1090202 [Mycena sanguinolenta]